MNTSPAAGSAPLRNDTAASASSNGDAPPGGAFELLFGSIGPLPLAVSQAPNQASHKDALASLPEENPESLGDLGAWLQQLPLPPLAPLAAAGSPTAATRAAVGLPLMLPSGMPALPVAADSTTNELPLTTAAAPPTGLDEAVAALLGPRAANADADLPRPAAPLAQQAPPALSAVVTRALMRNTELIGAKEASPAAQATGSPPAPAAVPVNHAPLEAALEVALPPGSAPKIDQAFSEGMAVRLQWMAQQQVGRAEIQLHPEDLGVLDVQIEFDGKTVRAEFHSASSEVRHLLESTLPRLRDLLETQGLQLAQADVGSGQGRQTGGESAAAAQRRNDKVGVEDPTAAGQNGKAAKHHQGVLSEYA